MFGLFAEPLPTRNWPVWARYLTTAVAVFVMLCVELGLRPAMPGHVFLVFLIPVIGCSVLFDRGSGFLALALSAAATQYVLLLPRDSVASAGHAAFAEWLLFVGIGLFIGIIIEAMHLAVQKLQQTCEELATSESEKDLLLREASHRMANDLQMVIGLMEIQQRRVADPAACAALASAAERLRLLSSAQQRLRRDHAAAVMDVRDFLTELCDDIGQAFSGPRPISIETSIEACALPQERAIALGLIVNELVTNALKHAFPNGRPGRVRVLFGRDDAEFRLTVKDDGIGMVESGAHNDSAGDEAGSLGQSLLRALAAQLGGHYEIGKRTGAVGTVARVIFPADA